MAITTTAALPLLLALALPWLASLAAAAGVTSPYVRPKPSGRLAVPQDALGDYWLTPQQVHVSLYGPGGNGMTMMRVTWITTGKAPAVVDYGTSPGVYPFSASGTTSSYYYILYWSGKIHDVVVGPLNYGTVYYYRCGGRSSREFSFRTPPEKLPVRLALAGDLGQTKWTNSTLEQIVAADYDALLVPGDLSYADWNQLRWDSFGRLVEPAASARPWMTTAGNHEVEAFPFLEEGFKAYDARWRMPHEVSGSASNHYYSFDVASVHVVMLASYGDFSAGSLQRRWLQSDLRRVDRSATKFVVAVFHAPWYSTNSAHQGDGEAMRRALERLLYEGRVDVVLAGHVHSYERFARVYGGKLDECGSVHITIGDAGNTERRSDYWEAGRPELSLFREASFGHGQLEAVNDTHAHWSWIRNDNGEPVTADEVWITSLASNPKCNKQ